MESVTENVDISLWSFSYANIRTDGYVILASLLKGPPSKDLLKILQDLRWDQALPEKLDHALKALCQESRNYSLAVLEAEFDRLFVGLGSGEMVPYASWYKKNMIHSSPLASLRSDLVHLGIVRQEDSCEPEDNAGTICEIMALISQESNNVPYTKQAIFFRQHVLPWMMTFFNDLQAAQGAQFYRTVGLFGRSFLEAENEYLRYGEKS
jgi:TorA maturation chaperone TorD